MELVAYSSTIVTYCSLNFSRGFFCAASEYLIKYSDVFDNLVDNNFNSNSSVQFGQENVLGGSMWPLPSGSKQRVSLALPKASESVTFYIALRAVNDKNDASSTSNVVSVKIAVIQQPPG